MCVCFRLGHSHQVGRCPGSVFFSPSSSCSSGCWTGKQRRGCPGRWNGQEQSYSRALGSPGCSGAAVLIFFLDLQGGQRGLDCCEGKSGAKTVKSTLLIFRGERKAKIVRSYLCLPSAPDTVCYFSLAFPATMGTQAGGCPPVNQDLCTAHCLLVDWVKAGLGQAIVNLDHGNNGVDLITVKIAFVVGLRKILRYCQWHDVLSRISIRMSELKVPVVSVTWETEPGGLPWVWGHPVIVLWLLTTFSFCCLFIVCQMLSFLSYFKKALFYL